MGDALALAGQGAANQCFFSTYFLIAFIPTITAPLVAKAAGSGDIESAATRVAEALFLANVLGLIGTVLLCLRPAAFLSVVLPAGAPAAEYAIKYLRLRSISLVPALLSSVGFVMHATARTHEWTNRRRSSCARASLHVWAAGRLSWVA